MTTLTDPPKDGFRLSQLVYDTRYRSITLQIIALILLCAAFYWLGSNTVTNLSIGDKDFDLGFLGQRAGYDINQRLIPYDSNSTHAAAALVGILNTILVSFLGVILATILGIIFGVLRLSKNWIVARLSAVYVESFRNVPLLLWIIAIFAVLTEATKAPKEFGPNGSASMLFGDRVAITNRDLMVPAPIFGEGSGLLIVAFLAAIAGAIYLRRQSIAKQADTGRPPLGMGAVIAIVIGVTGLVYSLQASIGLTVLGVAQLAIGAAFAVAGWAIGSWLTTAAGLSSRLGRFAATGLSAALALVWLYGISGPIFASIQAQLGIADTYTPALTFQNPELGGFNFKGGLQLRNSLIALWVALSLYTGSFIAEIVRAGILSVSKGQTEAAYALGMRPDRTMSLIILPQALRVIIPPLISQYLNLTKNSSLAVAISYMDVKSTLGGITVNQTGRELEGILLMGIFYLTLSLLISAGMNLFNNSVKLKER